jgi:hypothetical protein
MSNGQNQIPISISSTASSRLNTYGGNNNNNNNNISNLNQLNNNVGSSKNLNIHLINSKEAATTAAAAAVVSAAINKNIPVSGSSTISDSTTINIINGSASGAGIINSNARVPMQNVSVLENSNSNNILNVPIQHELEYADLEDLDKIITNERNNLNLDAALNSNESPSQNDENRNSSNNNNNNNNNSSNSFSATSTNGGNIMGKNSSSKSAHHHKHRYETLLLKELMQLSIKREKIEKALAATGYQRSIDAINWLMKHSKDPILLHDSIISTRDFILLLCPVGRLASQIDTFLQQSKFKCGTNEAHFNNSLPYMKLSPFFKVKRSLY